MLVAGFQGVSTDFDVTTLGRGGSDTTAVALAAALGAEACEIYTDVEGVFTADPRLVPDARKLHAVSYEEMLELAASGAKVLQLRSVEFARNHDVKLHVRSTFSPTDGTWIARRTNGCSRRRSSPASRTRSRRPSTASPASTAASSSRRSPRRTSTSTRSSRPARDRLLGARRGSRRGREVLDGLGVEWSRATTSAR